MGIMFNRFLYSIKKSSKATLRSWSYQCESILAQRSRRIAQLFTFYHRVYGSNGLRQLFCSYTRRLQPPMPSFLLSAIGALGVTVADNSPGSKAFDWSRERLSLKNFDVCLLDIEFINTLNKNKLCNKCQAKKMKYCYCDVGNKKCANAERGEKTISGCRKPMGLEADKMGGDGTAVIVAADNNEWEPYFSTPQFSIWRREERPSMFAYKVYARFDDISAAELLHVQTDLEYRKQWDESAVVLELIDVDPQPGTNSHVIYWEMQWPKLFSNRDYVYCRRFVTDHTHGVMMICNMGTEHPKYPQFPNKVRVTDYWSLMVMKPFRSFEEPGVHYILTYYDDPGVPIPNHLKSWVTQKHMPEFLVKMYNATKQYSCKRALEFKHLHRLENFNVMDNDYTANAARWLTQMWKKQRDNGKR